MPPPAAFYRRIACIEANGKFMKKLSLLLLLPAAASGQRNQAPPAKRSFAPTPGSPSPFWTLPEAPALPGFLPAVVCTWHPLPVLPAAKHLKPTPTADWLPQSVLSTLPEPSVGAPHAIAQGVRPGHHRRPTRWAVAPYWSAANPVQIGFAPYGFLFHLQGANQFPRAS